MFHACDNNRNNLIKKSESLFKKLNGLKPITWNSTKTNVIFQFWGLLIKMFGSKCLYENGGWKNLRKYKTWNGNRKKSWFWWSCAFVPSFFKKAGVKLGVLARLSKFMSFKQMNPYENICWVSVWILYTHLDVS